ncbi:nucleomorphin-like [Chenopodium quinoa]|uniref:nucleomorphin-like n=1 Tax=Chenopodium quinoa TaxID=63459 RepID=UPI000B797B9F|nr:nucleomorphin-like [Chenopodium quinoa]
MDIRGFAYELDENNDNVGGDNVNVDNDNVDVNNDNVNVDNNNINVEQEDVNLNNVDDFDQNVEENSDHNIHNYALIEICLNNNVQENNSVSREIYDPRIWEALDQKSIDILALNGSKRDLTIVKGPKDKVSKRFTANLYSRYLPNGETCDRD